MCVCVCVCVCLCACGCERICMGGTYSSIKGIAEQVKGVGRF